MRKKFKLFSLISVLLIASLLTACGEKDSSSLDASENTSEIVSGDVSTEVTDIDYASEIKLDLNSSDTLKIKADVRLFVDGDTTHFDVDKSIISTGVLKARYLAINTPESTGKIEEYGKKAAKFTKEKLSSATSIYLECEGSALEADSTGDRYLLWIWYKTENSEEYRNLNVEILQNGLAIASSSANNRYGEICMAALNQAKAQKLNVHSGQKDPDFYYGDAHELTLKELRCNIDTYNGTKVAFEGVITKNEGSTVYVETFDAETNMYYGISVYYGYNLTGVGLDIMSVGNEVRIVGSVQYYEAGGTYQISDISYRQMKPNDPNNIQKISSGNQPAYFPTTPETFANGTVCIATEDAEKTFKYAELAMNSSISMENLVVTDIYTTTSESSSSQGAMTLTCTRDGVTIDVRTTVLYDENNNLITADAYMGKTINVKGIVDYYSGSYQIKVLSANDITIVS